MTRRAHHPSVQNQIICLMQEAKMRDASTRLETHHIGNHMAARVALFVAGQLLNEVRP